MVIPFRAAIEKPLIQDGGRGITVAPAAFVQNESAPGNENIPILDSPAKAEMPRNRWERFSVLDSVFRGVRQVVNKEAIVRGQHCRECLRLIPRSGIRKLVVGSFNEEKFHVVRDNLSRRSADVSGPKIDLSLYLVRKFRLDYDPGTFGVNEGLRVQESGSSGLLSLSRLFSNVPRRDGCNDRQDPIGPLNGCIPLWRAILSGVCFLGGIYLVGECKGRLTLRLGTIGCIVGFLLGCAPWGRYDCKTGKPYCGIGSIKSNFHVEESLAKARHFPDLNLRKSGGAQ